MSPGKIMCFRHVAEPATRSLRVPCAPGGLLYVCDRCYGEERKEAFEAYFAQHTAAVTAMRVIETLRKIGDN